MKVIIYSGQNKFTVDNISIPNSTSIAELLKNRQEYTVSAADLRNYNFQITSTRGAIAEDDDFIMSEDIEREIEEGINWKLESVN
jgi:hypothetical protein